MVIGTRCDPIKPLLRSKLDPTSSSWQLRNLHRKEDKLRKSLAQRAGRLLKHHLGMNWDRLMKTKLPSAVMLQVFEKYQGNNTYKTEEFVGSY